MFCETSLFVFYFLSFWNCFCDREPQLFAWVTHIWLWLCTSKQPLRLCQNKTSHPFHVSRIQWRDRSYLKMLCKNSTHLMRKVLPLWLFTDVAPNSSNPYISGYSTDTQEASEELRGILSSTFMSTICHNSIFSKMENWRSNTVINYHSCLWVPYTWPVTSINFMAKLNMHENAGLIWSLMTLPLCRFHLERFQRTFSHNNVWSSQFSK